MASKCMFLIRRLFLDLEGPSIVNMGLFKTELLQRLHEELDCFGRFHPFIMACYLNINFMSPILNPKMLHNLKMYLVEDMVDVAS